MGVDMLTTWSFSRYSLYMQCPFKAKLKYIEGMVERTSPAMARGTRIHEEAEQFLLNPEAELPATLTGFSREFKKLKALGAVPEQEWALTSDWKPTTWRAPDVWCRIKVDALVDTCEKVFIIDFKTGKPRLEHEDQLSLYTLAGFIILPKALIIEAQDWYLDKPKSDCERITGDIYNIEQATGLRQMWQQRVEPMFSDKEFKPRVNEFCKWCQFNKANCGPCRY